ncbi:MAG: hypothetical protein Q9177_000794 [Variospora cf. flavescens]
MPPYRLTSHQLFDAKTTTRKDLSMPQYNIQARDLHARGFSLPTPTKSGHPIFPVRHRMASKYQPPSCESDDGSSLGVKISPQGTWKPVKDGHPTANIEVLDMSDRYGYKAPKAKPKNALNKGLKPTKNSELPPKRTIHEISSDNGDDTTDDDQTVSDPSPLRTKRPRITAASNPSQSRLSAIDELRAAAGKQTFSVLTDDAPTKPKTDKRGLFASQKQIHEQQQQQQQQPPPADSSDSSTTVLGTYEEDQPATTISRGHDLRNTTGTHASTINQATTGIRPSSSYARPEIIPGANPPPGMRNPPSTSNLPHQPFATSTLPTCTHPSPFSFTNASSALTTNQPPPSTTRRFTTTILRIYVPSTTSRIYVPLKLTSTPTLTSLFDAVETIIERETKILVMRFDAIASIPGGRDVARAAAATGCAAGGGKYPQSRFGTARAAPRAGSGGNNNDEDGDDRKGMLAVKKGVGSSWDCFLDEVLMRSGEGDGGRGVGVSVEVK